MFLEMRLEVKVTVTWKMYVTLHNPEMHPDKFGIPRRYALKIFPRTESSGQDPGHSALETVCDTLQPKNVSEH